MKITEYFVLFISAIARRFFSSLWQICKVCGVKRLSSLCSRWTTYSICGLKLLLSEFQWQVYFVWKFKIDWSRQRKQIEIWEWLKTKSTSKMFCKKLQIHSEPLARMPYCWYLKKRMQWKLYVNIGQYECFVWNSYAIGFPRFLKELKNNSNSTYKCRRWK